MLIRISVVPALAACFRFANKNNIPLISYRIAKNPHLHKFFNRSFFTASRIQNDDIDTIVLRVSKLPLTLSAYVLTTMFEQHGTVIKVDMEKRGKFGGATGVALISMDKKGAKAAIKKLNGSFVSGKEIEVVEALPIEENNTKQTEVSEPVPNPKSDFTERPKNVKSLEPIEDWDFFCNKVMCKMIFKIIQYRLYFKRRIEDFDFYDEEFISYLSKVFIKPKKEAHMKLMAFYLLRKKVTETATPENTELEKALLIYKIKSDLLQMQSDKLRSKVITQMELYEQIKQIRDYSTKLLKEGVGYKSEPTMRINPCTSIAMYHLNKLLDRPQFKLFIDMLFGVKYTNYKCNLLLHKGTVTIPVTTNEHWCPDFEFITLAKFLGYVLFIFDSRIEIDLNSPKDNDVVIIITIHDFPQDTSGFYKSLRNYAPNEYQPTSDHYKAIQVSNNSKTMHS